MEVFVGGPYEVQNVLGITVSKRNYCMPYRILLHAFSMSYIYRPESKGDNTFGSVRLSVSDRSNLICIIYMRGHLILAYIFLMKYFYHHIFQIYIL